MKKSNLPTFTLLLVIALCLALEGCAAREPQSPTGVTKTPAVPLMAIQSPLGFSVDVPAGWVQKPVPQAPNVLVFSPPGAAAHSIYILPALRVSDMRFQAILGRCSQAIRRSPLFAPDAFTGCVQPAVSSQLADSSQGWSPEAAFRAILATLGSGQTRFGTPQITPTSQNSARFSVPAASMGRQLEDWGFVTTTYLPNPLLAQANGRGGVTTLGFVSGCSAPPADVERFSPLCAAALHSFHPSTEWVNRLAQAVYSAYAQESQILLRMGNTMVDHFAERQHSIAQFGSAMQQMQYSTYQAVQAANLRTGENEIATLGNNVILRDPTTGQMYLEPAGRGSYCLNAGGSDVLTGTNMAPGKYIDSPADQCAQMLEPAE
jgi:hypothetical protein